MNKFTKPFTKVKKSSEISLNTFEETIERLRSDNEELANIQVNVVEEIENLKKLKGDISECIAVNQNAISGLERVLNGQ